MLPMADPLDEIRRLYFATTRATIEQDFEKALSLLKAMPSEEERERATVFMHGLAQMRAEWGLERRNAGARRPAPKPDRPRPAGQPAGRRTRPGRKFD
jgi:hypothetical protein